MEPTQPGGTVQTVDFLYNYISAVCWCIATTLSVLTNGFLLLVVHRSLLTDDVRQTFIASTSVVILGLTLCLGPLAVITSIADGQWVLGGAMCTVQSLLLVVVLSTLSVIMFIFSIERYVFILQPLRYPSLITVTRVRCVIAFAVSISLPCALINGILSEWRGLYVPSWHACLPDVNLTNRTFYLCGYLVLKLVPAVVGYAIHCSLLLIARRHLHRIIAVMPPAHSTIRTDETTNGRVAVVIGRRLKLNTTRCVFLSLFALFFLAVDLIPDLACFYQIPHFLVLPGNLAFLFASCFLQVAHLLSSATLRRTARQTLYRCLCKGTNSDLQNIVV